MEILPPENKLAPLVLTLEPGLEQDTQQSLLSAFQGFYASADEWRAKALSIQITRPDQIREMKLARETRLALREIRIKADKRRKEMKEDSLRRGKAIDGAFNMLAHAIEPLERHLLEQEQFIIRMEEERKAKLKIEREDALRPFADVSLYQLGEMDEATFSQLLETNRLGYAARKAEAERIERERIEAEERAKREAVEAAERARIRAENERLKAEREAAEVAAKAEREAAQAEVRRIAENNRKEREAIEAKAKAEREAIEAKAKAEREAAAAQARKEREAREAAEAALKAKEAEEQRKRDAALAAARAAAAAPDREKLAKLAANIRALEIPTLTTAAGREIQDLIQTQVTKFAVWVENQTTKLQ